MTHPIPLDDDEVIRSIAARALRLEEYAVVDKMTRLDRAMAGRLHHFSGSEGLATRLQAHADNPALLDRLRALLDGKR
jgi:hypothetical protein